jgi:hypothetical protein
MARSLFVFLPITVLLGSALVSYGMNTIPSRKDTTPPGKVAPVTFTQVQEAVAKVRTAHMVFRMISDDISTPVMTYEAWLKADTPAFAVRTPEGRIIGDATGVRQIASGNLPVSLSNNPVTENRIRQEMLFPQFNMRSRDSLDKWGKCRVETDISGRNLLQFVAEAKGVRRTLWVDPKTRLPLRMNIEMQNDLVSDTASPQRRNEFHVIYFYDKTLPSGIFTSPEESGALLAANAVTTK